MDAFRIDLNERSLSRRVTWGVRWGTVLASAFALFALVQYGLHGSAIERSTGFSLGDVVSIYFAGGVVGGAFVGLVLPLARRKVGSAFVGFLAILPVAILIRVTAAHTLAMSRMDLLVAFGGSAMIGIPLGVSIFEEEVQPERDNASA